MPDHLRQHHTELLQIDREMGESLCSIWSCNATSRMLTEYAGRLEDLAKRISELSQPKKKESTNRGEAEDLIVAAITEHHGFDGRTCSKLEPIGVNELARQRKISRSTVSAFFRKQYKGHQQYRTFCHDPSRLVASLQLLRREMPPSILAHGLSDRASEE